MASQTKVDSAGRSAAERRTEGSSASYSANTSASGTFAARGDGRGKGAPRAAREDELVGEASDAGSDPEHDAADQGADQGAEPAPPSGDDALAAARVSSIEELGQRPAQRASGSQDDEDVSLDELLISDSAEEEEEEEEEATDIHPGLSEAVLAESLRGPPVPVIAREPIEPLEELEEEVPSAVDVAAESVALEVAPASERDEVDLPELEAVSTDQFGPVDVAAEEMAAQEAALAAQEAASATRNPSADEPTEPDASPADGLESEAARPEPLPAVEAALDVEAAFEVEAALESEAAQDAAAAEAAPLEDADDDDDDEAPMSAELLLEDNTGEPPLAAAAPDVPDRKTMPETLSAKRKDAPLPSFDMLDLEAVSSMSAAVAAPAAEQHSRVVPRAVDMPPLAEIDEEEEDDDAVTHMGLPVVPEVANDHPPVTSSGFQVADPAVAALQSIDADLAHGNSRRATTRVIPRVDPKSLPDKPRVHVRSGPPLSERVTGVLRDAWGRVQRLVQSDAAAPALDLDGLSPARRRLGWFVENVLPPLSLVLFGSGVGAGIIMLVETDRPADATGQAVQALQESSKAPVTLVERARAGEGEALYKITNMPHGERSSSLTLALEAGYQSQKLREFKEFAKSASAAPSKLSAAGVSRMVEYATSPETMLPAFQELTQWPGPVGPDVLYAVWEKAAGGSRAASLAQQLLYSTDQRAKATPALVVALDLRSAANCDDYARVLPAVQRDGDQRSSATLRALRHKDGCGADGQQDCYACLREGSLLDDTLKAVEAR